MILSRTLTALLVTAAVCSCVRPHTAAENDEEEVHVLPDTLTVATLYSPMSFFYFRDQPMGYDYELLTRVATDHGLPIDWEIAPSLATAIEWLDSGRVDMIAYEVPITAEYREHVVPCGIESVTRQVLVQPLNSNQPKITDVTELVGRDVYVEKNSKYQARLENLDKELGGGINIHVINRDTLITEDLVEMVSDGKIPLTIVDNDIARINRTYFPGLDVNVEVSLDQRAAWGVSPKHAWLADSINAWTGGEAPRKVRSQLLRRYFELSKGTLSPYTVNFKGGRISDFDDIFRRYAPKAGLDWRMLAAQAFIESRFDPTVVSWAGARGIMQIMPATARAFGVSADNLVDNETSVDVASRIISRLDKSLESKVPDKEQRIDFILAAYNAGLAHILDAIELAKVVGLDPTRWSGNVENALLLKGNPDYYNNPVVKYGYFRGRQTTEYVRSVRDFYSRAIKAVKH